MSSPFEAVTTRSVWREEVIPAPGQTELPLPCFTKPRQQKGHYNIRGDVKHGYLEETHVVRDDNVTSAAMLTATQGLVPSFRGTWNYSIPICIYIHISI